jgi:hypothetical protein
LDTSDESFIIVAEIFFFLLTMYILNV